MSSDRLELVYTYFTIYIAYELWILIVHHRCDDDEEWEHKMDWCCSWLYTRMNDGKPRMLISDREFYLATDCPSFIERIKKASFLFIKTE
jgi:hypothetical protein